MSQGEPNLNLESQTGFDKTFGSTIGLDIAERWQVLEINVGPDFTKWEARDRVVNVFKEYSGFGEDKVDQRR